jgi:hypothetical protein
LAQLQTQFQVGGVFIPKLVQRFLRLVHLDEEPVKAIVIYFSKLRYSTVDLYLSTVVTLTSWPGQGSFRRTRAGLAFDP